MVNGKQTRLSARLPACAAKVSIERLARSGPGVDDGSLGVTGLGLQPDHRFARIGANDLAGQSIDALVDITGLWIAFDDQTIADQLICLLLQAALVCPALPRCLGNGLNERQLYRSYGFDILVHLPLAPILDAS